MSGKRKEHKDSLLGPETAGWGVHLAREEAVVEKFLPSLDSSVSWGYEEREPGMSQKFCHDDALDPWGQRKSSCPKGLCSFLDDA